MTGSLKYFQRLKDAGKKPDEVAKIALDMGEDRQVVLEMLALLYGVSGQVALGAVLVAEGGEDHNV